MSYLPENLRHLQTTQPHLSPPADNAPVAGLEFLAARTGAVTARLEGIFLHSCFDPVKEARNLIRGKIKQGLSAAIFFGFGLGYQIEEFLQICARIPVLIFEPNAALFYSSLAGRPLGAILANPRVRILLGMNFDLVAELQQLPVSCVQVIKLRSIYAKEAEFYRNLEEGIHAFLAKKEINLNTLHRFGKLWVKNLVRNIRLLTEMPGIACLQDFFTGFPALILAAGPSLELIRPYLQELRQRFLIIAVDTSLRICLAQGVEPDFIVVVDPQYWNTRHLDWAAPQQGWSGESCLISESSTHPRIFTSLPLPGFFASSFFPLGIHFESLIGYKGKIGAGGSVATSAWDFARLAGCGPLYLAGLDLGFPGKQTHFKGAFFEHTFLAVTNRLKPAEGMSFAYLQQAQPYYTDDNRGSRVLTDKRMNLYQSWFETQLKLYPDAQSFNLSPGGVKIRGMATADPACLLRLPCIRTQLAERKAEMAAFFRPLDREKAAALLSASLQELLDDLQVLERRAKTGLQQTAEMRRLLGRGKPLAGALAQLNKTDAAILGQSSRVIAGFLLQPVIHNIVNSSTITQSPAEIIENSEGIYRQLRDSAAYHHRLLKQALARLAESS